MMADKLLKIKSDGFQVQVTLGWEAPNNRLSPVGTFVMPLPFAQELAKELSEQFEKQSKSTKSKA